MSEFCTVSQTQPNSKPNSNFMCEVYRYFILFFKLKWSHPPPTPTPTHFHSYKCLHSTHLYVLLILTLFKVTVVSEKVKLLCCCYFPVEGCIHTHTSVLWPSIMLVHNLHLNSCLWNVQDSLSKQCMFVGV